MLLRQQIDGFDTQAEDRMSKFYLGLVFAGVAVLAFGCLLGLQRLVG
jgi:hypothetical protein